MKCNQYHYLLLAQNPLQARLHLNLKINQNRKNSILEVNHKIQDRSAEVETKNKLKRHHQWTQRLSEEKILTDMYFKFKSNK